MQQLAQHIAHQVSISKEDLDLILSKFESGNFKKKEHLLNFNSISNQVFFIAGGCVRTYVIDYNGTEHNIFFPTENWWAGDLQSFINRSYSTCGIQALEDTTTFSISNENWQLLVQELPPFLEYTRTLFQNNIIEQQKRITQYLSFTAKERYEYFIEQHPALMQRIAQKHIASYLGITPEFLSILRSRVLKE